MDNERQDIFDRLMHLPGLRIFETFYKKNKSVLLYLFFGGLTTIVSVGTFVWSVNVLNLNELLGNIISWIFAVTFAYVTNRIWVFHSVAKGKQILTEALSFYAGRLTSLGIEEAVIFIFVTLLHFSSFWVKIAAQFIVLVLNYFISKFLVFRDKKQQ